MENGDTDYYQYPDLTGNYVDYHLVYALIIMHYEIDKVALLAKNYALKRCVPLH